MKLASQLNQADEEDMKYKKMIMKIMTVRTRDSFQSFKNSVSSSQTNALPKNIPSFTPVKCLNNHYFSVNGAEFEFVDGQFYQKLQTLHAGDAFGQDALQRQLP